MRFQIIHPRVLLLGLALVAILPPTRAGAFALLGPFSDWMQPTNGLRLLGDIGGPMKLNEEYRWNVPVLTYGFDSSFLDYFGSNGVAAVEEAFQILNDLPAASEVVLADYPRVSRRINWAAHHAALWDLRSFALANVVEQMGLASPTRHVFVLRHWRPAFEVFIEEREWSPWAIDFGLILERNFDPESLSPTHSVNGTVYSGQITRWMNHTEVTEFPLDPIAIRENAVADYRYGNALGAGQYYDGLTRDDVGGLCYLLHATNINFEALPPEVRGVSTNADNLVRTAWRPGVEKITFIRHLHDPVLGRFTTLEIPFADRYITNGTVMQQCVQRVIEQPDFLFRAADLRATDAPISYLERTGTSNWWNSAVATGEPEASGPGVIRGPVVVTFHKYGLWVNSPHVDGLSYYPGQWGSSAGTTNTPTAYPSEALADAMPLKVYFWFDPPPQKEHRPSFCWNVPIRFGEKAWLQYSADLHEWRTLGAVTNTGTVIDWGHYRTSSQGFFRILAE